MHMRGSRKYFGGGGLKDIYLSRGGGVGPFLATLQYKCKKNLNFLRGTGDAHKLS